MLARTTMNAVFLDWLSLDQGDLDASPLLEVVDELGCFGFSHPHEVPVRLQDVEVAIANKALVGREAFEAATRLRLLCVAATGTNNVDLEAAKEHGVVVCNVQAYGTASVVQHVFGCMIALHNRLLEADRAVRRGRWPKSRQFCLLEFPITELAGKTLGIVGFGALGQAVGKLAEAFGMHVLVAKRDESDTRAGRVELDELLEKVDVLSLHCPLTDDNHQMINAERLALMKRSAFLINTARGGLIEEEALASALREKRLAGAALDVLSTEPPPADHPLLDTKLPNLIVTPHIAWASREARQRIVVQLAENIRAFEDGAPRRVV